MADNISTPGGAVPPKPAEASKVQPKKETVRINLPPKPTSAPTIKLPTLAPGAPAASSAAAPAAPAAAAAPRAAAPAAAPVAAVAAVAAAPAKPATTAKPAAPAPVPRPAAPAVARGMTGLDKGLAIAAMVASLAALGCVIYITFVLKDPSAAM
jgi:hypothetical protein